MVGIALGDVLGGMHRGHCHFRTELVGEVFHCERQITQTVSHLVILGRLGEQFVQQIGSLVEQA